MSPTGSVHSGRFHLTFDGGPNPPGTDRLIEQLERHGVMATFFFEGHRLEAHAQCARRVVEAGHEIGNHSYTHREMDGLNRAKVMDEVVQARDIIERETGVTTRQFRPPWGRLARDLVEAVHSTGHDVVLWNRSVRDWEGPDSRSILHRLRGVIDDGAIVVLHDRVLENAELIGELASSVRDAGLDFRPVSEAPRSECVIRAPETESTR